MWYLQLACGPHQPWSRRQDGNLYREWRNVSAIREESGHIKFIASIFFEIS